MIFIFGLVSLMFSGCGSGGGGGGKSAPSNDTTTTTSTQVTTTTLPFTQSGKVELKGDLNKKFDSLGNLKYLGEVVNGEAQPVCFVKVVVDSKNAAGGLIKSDFTYIDGSTLSVGSVETDTCLNQGEAAGFELLTSLKSDPASFNATLNWESDNIAAPAVSPSQLVVDGAITSSTDFFGDLTLKGFVKNLHPSKTVEFVRISFVVIKGGKVGGTQFTFVNGSTCNSTDTCLAPGAEGSFEVNFSFPPSEMDSYYYKINYSVSK